MLANKWLLIAIGVFIPVYTFAAPMNQIKIKPIYKDANHTVYLSKDWIVKTKLKNLKEVTVLFDYDFKKNHSGFEGNMPYLSSETRYVINCKNKSIAFRGDKTYSAKMASGNELDYHERRFDVIEFLNADDLDNVTDFTSIEVDNSYKQIIQSTCN